MAGPFPESDISRFWAKVDRGAPDECWEWSAARSRGYGVFWYGMRLGKAHRFSYELHCSEIPDGHEIDHLCRNPSCVNPSHLEPVTHRENMLRGETLGAREAAKTHCPMGHEYVGSNTVRRPSRPNKRECRECIRIRRAGRSARGLETGAAS